MGLERSIFEALSHLLSPFFGVFLQEAPLVSIWVGSAGLLFLKSRVFPRQRMCLLPSPLMFLSRQLALYRAF